MARLEQRAADGGLRVKHEPSGRRAWLWMALCCIPMVAIVVLVALGVWNLW